MARSAGDAGFASVPVWLYLGSADRWEAIDYYAGSSGLVGYASNGSDHLITFPCAPENVAQALSQWLGWDDLPDVPVFQADLQANELAMLAAVVDAHREENLRAVLERRQPNVSRFSREQLLYELETAAQTADPRWFAGILQRHAPPGFQPGPASLNEGASSLGSRGLVTFEGDDVLITADLAAVAAVIASLGPYAILSVGSAGESGSVSLVLRTIQSFWTIDFLASQDGQSWARLQRLSGPDLHSHIQQALSVLPKAAPDPSAWTAPVQLPVAPPHVAPSPARGEPPVAQAPRATRAPTQERRCVVCDKPLAPGRKFCTGCGTAVG